MNPFRKLHEAILYSIAQPAPATAYDRRAVPVYWAIASIIGLELAFFALSDFYLGSTSLTSVYLFLYIFLGLALYLRRRHLERFALLLEAVALPGIAGGLAVVGTTFLASVSYPFIDPGLNAADRAIGFDFPAWVEFYRQNPRLASVSHSIYFSFTIQTVAAPLVLAICNRTRSFWVFVLAWYLALFAAVAIFPFATAYGPYVFHGLEPPRFDTLQRFFPWKFGEMIEGLRNGTMRDISEAARGIVTMPSFHAAGGALFIWAAWQIRWLRWPVLALNLAMFASIPVTGSHYLVDVFAGIALAALAVWISSRIIARIERGSVQASSSTSQ